MNVADERGVRRALAFAHMLEHQHIVRCCGSWEDEKALYIVEEYALKGDLLQVRAGRCRTSRGLCPSWATCSRARPAASESSTCVGGGGGAG